MRYQWEKDAMAEVILKNIRKVYDKEVVAVDDANIEIKTRNSWSS